MAVVGTEVLPMCAGMIGPSVWRNNTLKEINLSENVIRRSDQANELGKTLDPLPHLRDILAELSNEEELRYGRQVRLVVYRLRESIIDTNDEMKMLNRIRECLERMHEHIRKDIIVNLQSQRIRTARPAREKCKDGADDLLDAERLTLLSLKKMLEEHLKLVKEQLQVLEAARRRLTNVNQERSRVLDLICAAIPSIGSQSAYVNMYILGPRHRCSSRASSINGACSKDQIFQPDQLGPYTPECETALEDARTARARSEQLRCDAVNLIEKVEKIQREAHEAVNQGLKVAARKVAETINLKGPVSTHDLVTHEKLNRPIISTFQRHPGTNMPEAQEIVRMKVFVVFFCMIIGYACVDSQLAEIGEDDLKSNNNGWKADSLYDNEAINEDQYNRSTGDNVPAQSADSRSKETEASEKPSSAVTPMTVTSEVKKSGQMAYLAARVIDLWSLLKHSHRHISAANRHSMEVKRSFPRPSAAIRDTDTDSAIKTRRSFRTKRSAARDAKRKKLEAGGGFFTHNVELQILARQFVRLLINQMKVCVEKEGKVIESLEKTGTVATDVLKEYKTAKTTERELLKVVCDDAELEDPPEEPEDIVDRYKLFYRDTCFDEYLFDDFRLRQKHQVFFDTPPALTKYYAMKCREYETIDDYYLGSGPDEPAKDEFEEGANDNSTKSEFECPKKKRESGSQASQMHAQVFVIFLCMVIGTLVIDLYSGWRLVRTI